MEAEEAHLVEVVAREAVRILDDGGRSSGGGRGRRRDGVRGRSTGYGSSFSSFSASSSDRSEITVVTGKRHVTPSLVDVASSAARLDKLSVTGDRAKPASSRLAHVLSLIHI